MLGFPLLIVLMLALAGCATTVLGPVPGMDDKAIRIIDNRVELEKKSFRQSPISPLALLGDDDFDVNPLLHFKAELLKRTGSEVPALVLEVEKFRIGDYFPQRLQAGTSAAAAGALYSLGYTVYFGDHTQQVDGVVCVFEGRINSRPVQVSSFVPYHISPMAGLVRTQPQFLAAVRTSIERCAEQAYSRAK